MKVFQILTIIFFVLLSSLVSVAQSPIYEVINMYAPNETLNLDLTEQGDWKVLAATGVINRNQWHLNTQMAFSPLKNIGIGIDYFKIIPHQLSSSKPTNINANSTEIYLGTYYRLNSQDAKLAYIKSISLYGGYGQGNIFSENDSVSSEFSYQKYFVQLGFTQEYERLRLGINAKIGVLGFKEGKVLGSIDNLAFTALDAVQRDNNYGFLELNASLELVLNPALNIYGNFTIGNPFEINYGLYIGEVFRVGLSMDIDYWYRKPKRDV